MKTKQKVLILGATGMLGHVLLKRFFHNDDFEVHGTVRKLTGLKQYFSEEEMKALIPNVDADNFDSILHAFRVSKPDIVINCIGIIKHLPSAKNHFMAININALFPHKLANLCEVANARLVHVSTDCVFKGTKGDYTEADLSNAEDIYGKTKFLGEVDYEHAITLRTSIIGHELQTNIALVDWFLNQEGKVNGYEKAIYTGVTTYELANVIINYVIPNESLHGLYQVASDKISKYDLIKLIAKTYHKTIDIAKFSDFVLDRSLLADQFKIASGYSTPSWGEMIQDMYKYYGQWQCYRPKFGEKYLIKR